MKLLTSPKLTEIKNLWLNFLKGEKEEEIEPAKERWRNNVLMNVNMEIF